MKQINNILNQNWDFALQNLLYIQYSTYNVGCSCLLVLYSVLILISILSIIFTIMILLIYFLGNVYACVHIEHVELDEKLVVSSIHLLRRNSRLCNSEDTSDSWYMKYEIRKDTIRSTKFQSKKVAITCFFSWFYIFFIKLLHMLINFTHRKNWTVYKLIFYNLY